MDIRTQREGLGLSQSHLSRLSGVSRFKLCQHELGARSLMTKELAAVEQAIRAEAARVIKSAQGLSAIPPATNAVEGMRA